ncbi:MAG: potassium channel family protein [Gaiellaceae bacterium]
MARTNLLDRRLNKLLHETPTVRLAASAIVTGTAIVVIGAGILIRVVDHSEFDNVWVGMWWALQTATTVGYGDVTPAHVSGRIVAAFVMLQGIAFLAILTAAITSVFVARASEELHKQHEAEEAAEAKDGAEADERLERLAHFDARFDELERKLDRLEAALRR